MGCEMENVMCRCNRNQPFQRNRKSTKQPQHKRMKINLRIFTFMFIALCASAVSGAEPIKSAITGHGFVADFYCTEGSSPKPGILFLGGSEGGKLEHHLPEFFATNGYAVLSLAYFKAEGLPDTLEMVPLEYFDKAIGWLTDNQKIQHGGIVVYGASKGAELALLLASKKSEIKGVIAVAPSSVVWQGMPKAFWPPPQPRSSWSLQEKPVPFVPYDYSMRFDPGDPLAIYKFYKQSLTQKESVEKAAIEVEKIHGPVLLLSGHDDRLWPSEEMGDVICKRLKEKVFKYKYEHVKYNDAGHTLNEYYMLGGTPEGNRKARIDSTGRMLEFLKMVNKSISGDAEKLHR